MQAVSMGQPLTGAQGVVLVVGAILAMNRIKAGVRERRVRPESTLEPLIERGGRA